MNGWWMYVLMDDVLMDRWLGGWIEGRIIR